MSAILLLGPSTPQYRRALSRSPWTRISTTTRTTTKDMPGRWQHSTAVTSTASGHEERPVLEVERKFVIPESASNNTMSTIYDRLRNLGMEPVSTQSTVFVDWYFDHPTNFSLTIHDCWLRYRHLKNQTGTWQLKRGRKMMSEQSPKDATRTDGYNDVTRSTTVYEEFEGSKAIEQVIGNKLFLPPTKSTSDTNENKHRIPELDGQRLPEEAPIELSNLGLVPFARIETSRSSWSMPFSATTEAALQGVAVDLDTTDFGYVVGEVEIVVQREDELPVAQERVNALASQLSLSDDNEESTTPIGKLEYYLKTKSPEHYQLCIQHGTLKDVAENSETT